MDGEGADLGSKLNHAHIGGARHTIARLLSRDIAGIEGEHRAIRSADAGDADTGRGGGERLVRRLVGPLQPVGLSPRYRPSSEPPLQDVLGPAPADRSRLRRLQGVRRLPIMSRHSTKRVVATDIVSAR